MGTNHTLQHLKILLLEDNPHDVELLANELKKSEMLFTLHVVDSKEEYISALEEFKPDVILSDHSLPSFNSLMALAIKNERFQDAPFILVTGTVSEEFAVECMKAGADDYILKNSLMRLPSAIKTVFSKKLIQREKEIIESLHKKLQSAYREIEDKNTSITDSINYARRIQMAMLPEKGALAKIFPGSFVLYKPKDIISGDFYWVEKFGNRVYLAVADCTGHGVPGAMMSMMGYNFLNEIVTHDNHIAPEEILKKLHKKVLKFLKQDKEKSRTQDGMDIALCCIDTITHKVKFSGANRSLIYFQKGVLNTIKGNKDGIGGVHVNIEFTGHEVELSPCDSFYLFTDGYADQFGGENGRKMMTRTMVELLQTINPLDMHQQGKTTFQWFEDWKGKHEQTDDALLIGVRI